MTFGTLIRDKRLAKNVTIQELSDAVGCAKQSIVNIEKDKYNTQAQLAVKVCVYLKISSDDFFKIMSKK